MVCYCCVQGCGNNSNVKKKDPNSVISFHAFPSNQELKTKWLKAIGRPNWTPANHARICSAHFKYEQINYDGCRIRIKDDAVPVNLLPPNSNFEASNVEACRICLATDIELCSLQDPQLGACMETIAGVNASIQSISVTVINYFCILSLELETGYLPCLLISMSFRYFGTDASVMITAELKYMHVDIYEKNMSV